MKNVNFSDLILIKDLLSAQLKLLEFCVNQHSYCSDVQTKKYNIGLEAYMKSHEVIQELHGEGEEV